METRARLIRGRSWALVLTLGLVLTPAPSVAASATSQNCDPEDKENPPDLTEPVEICRTVVLEGSAPGVVKVRFPVEVRLDRGNPLRMEDIEVEGEGPFTGVLITEGQPEPGTFPSYFLVGCFADRFGTTLSDGSFHRVCWYWQQTFGPLGERVYIFPPGEYFIHLVTDNRPARVTLHFGGNLHGSLELSSQHPSTVEMQEHEPKSVPQGDVNVYAVDGRGEIRDQGIGLAAIANSSSSGVNRSSNILCQYTMQDIGGHEVPNRCPNMGTSVSGGWEHSLSSQACWLTTGKHGSRITGAHAPAHAPRALIMWLSAEGPAEAHSGCQTSGRSVGIAPDPVDSPA